MASKQETKPPNERPKFNISLAEFLRKGLTARDYTTYKPEHLISEPATRSRDSEPDTELTPQQKARKRYEERNKEKRREKARERMAKRRAVDYEANRVKQKDYEEQYCKTHREERRYGEDRRRAM
ncbi:hypothetical protein F5878DRAFT_645789 [Lentinula raphanica]|uniref:Uncharacterized protein n=1 Tax=Lentinula raphanica TaxID=153919 RepID=A0AA38NZZ9_9AGAR|nr:hypothetical protein F5878DRAFT_645789 [Lentinula raphanica]